MISRDALFKSLADPTRRAICENGELPVTALTRSAGISQPAVSKHLGILRNAGLVAARQDGRQTFYHAELQAIEGIADWTVEMRSFWNRRLDTFEDLLNRMDQ